VHCEKVKKLPFTRTRLLWKSSLRRAMFFLFGVRDALLAQRDEMKKMGSH